MNINLFDDMEGIVLRERENMLDKTMPRNNNTDQNGNMTRFPENTPLAMSYVPYQIMNETYSPEDALNCGTLYPELVYPFRRGGNTE